MNYRKSKMLLNEVYFWTNTIKDWKNLLKPKEYKQLVVKVLTELVNRQLIKVYGFVIMPNHLHLIWEPLARNGKEMPHASFNKATSHIIVKDLRENNQDLLTQFKVNSKERQYRIWQRDPLAIHMFSRPVIEQKLGYIHLNPLQEKWSLVKFPEDYKWSSASFYETGEDEFGILTHYRERF